MIKITFRDGVAFVVTIIYDEGYIKLNNESECCRDDG